MEKDSRWLECSRYVLTDWRYVKYDLYVDIRCKIQEHTKRQCHVEPPSIPPAIPSDSSSSQPRTERHLSRDFSSQKSMSVPGACSPSYHTSNQSRQKTQCNQTYSQIVSFLNGLQIPCLHLANIFEEFGLILEMSLDELCMENEMWDELKEYLLENGATRLEWHVVEVGLQLKENQIRCGNVNCP